MTFSRAHMSLSAFAAQNLPPWWEKIDEDPDWQEYSFLGLAAGALSVLRVMGSWSCLLTVRHV